jgi:thiol-disulfide isomerase/thioredoxin
MADKRNNAAPPMTLVVMAVLSAFVGFAAVYVTLGRPDNAGTVNGTAAGKSKTSAAESRGMTAFVFKRAAEELPDVSFVDGTGAAKSLKNFRGKTVLLNLWATWCAPCREEMPSLDRLKADLGSEKFDVVALAVDRTGLEAARKFLDKIKIEHLDLYADPSTRSGSALRVVGMPTTILIDAEGREIGRLPGPAAWDSPDAKRLIEASLR